VDSAALGAAGIGSALRLSVVNGSFARSPVAGSLPLMKLVGGLDCPLGAETMLITPACSATEAVIASGQNVLAEVTLKIISRGMASCSECRHHYVVVLFSV
jgi:hypothetical protein